MEGEHRVIPPDDPSDPFGQPEDPLHKLDDFRGLIYSLLDLAEEICRKTKTEIDDRTVDVIRRVVERLLG